MKHHHRTIKCKERERSKNRKYNEIEKQGKLKDGKKKKEGFYAISELMRALVCLSCSTSGNSWLRLLLDVHTETIYDIIMGKVCAIEPS